MSLNRTELQGLIRDLERLHSDMKELKSEYLNKYVDLHESYRKSAGNLLDYLALRRRDIRHHQETLAHLGLSSLGRAESHPRVTVEAVLARLQQIEPRETTRAQEVNERVGFAEGRALLVAHTQALLGPKPAGRGVRIMVTMPSEAADDYELVRDLVKNGMDCVRINCAYDGPIAWGRMISNLRRAESELGRSCRVLMDLAGPKLRTGGIEPGPRVLKWRPRRDVCGNVIAPARIWLTPIETPPDTCPTADAWLKVPGNWLAERRIGDRIKFFDARGSSRSMKICEVVGPNRWAESSQTAYVAEGTTLHCRRKKRCESESTCDEARVGDLPPTVVPLVLHTGDSLILTGDDILGKPAATDKYGKTLMPATIGVTLLQIFCDVRPGEAVWFDDGRVGGIISSVGEKKIEVEITNARANGSKLVGDKGINLPDSDLRLPALTEKDIEDLAFIAKNADLVGYSFVRSQADVRELQSRLADLGGERLGVVLKIETRRAFERLPELLLAAMHSPSAGVMIARGDLAVECGWERMAEVQEEVLWIAEAAHMPVIWATQVLEAMAKKGQPSRAEITDAAMGERAECVMLNKGPFIVQAARTLDDILRRMEAHQTKKSSMLRPLSLADRFLRMNSD